MVYLDTHVVVWFYANEKQRFSRSLQMLMNQHDWYISPIVRLELQLLHEIGRVNPTADMIISDMAQRVGLTVCDKPFDPIAVGATQLIWTRDPFDRLLVAHAGLKNDILITADEQIRANYVHAVW